MPVGFRISGLKIQSQAAMATVQRQNGEAVVVDGYKAMYDRLAAERVSLVERAVELEYENKLLSTRTAELEAEAAELRRHHAKPHVRFQDTTTF